MTVKEGMTGMEEQTFTVPGRLIQPINPSLLTTHTHIPFYLFQSPGPIALTASITAIFGSLMVSDLKSVPKLAPTTMYPYREATGMQFQLETCVIEYIPTKCFKLSPTFSNCFS